MRQKVDKRKVEILKMTENFKIKKVKLWEKSKLWDGGLKFWNNEVNILWLWSQYYKKKSTFKGKEEI